MLLWPLEKLIESILYNTFKYTIDTGFFIKRVFLGRYLGFKEILWPNYTILYIRWFQNHYPLILVPAWKVLIFIT